MTICNGESVRLPVANCRARIAASWSCVRPFGRGTFYDPLAEETTLSYSMVFTFGSLSQQALTWYVFTKRPFLHKPA